MKATDNYYANCYQIATSTWLMTVRCSSFLQNHDWISSELKSKSTHYKEMIWIELLLIQVLDFENLVSKTLAEAYYRAVSCSELGHLKWQVSMREHPRLHEQWASVCTCTLHLHERQMCKPTASANGDVHALAYRSHRTIPSPHSRRSAKPERSGDSDLDCTLGWSFWI